MKTRYKPLLLLVLAMPALAGTGMGAAPARAGEVYRCDGADGVRFQDSPCPSRYRQSRPRLAPEPAPALPPPTAQQPAVAAAPTAVEAPPPAPVARVPPPSFHLCRAGDGSQYMSSSGVGRTHWVPYGVLDGRNQSLAEAYGGPSGLASHPSGAAHIPHRPAPPGSAAGHYVEVTDPCHHAGPAEACAWLRGELDALDGRIRRASSDTLATLRRQREALAAQARGCR
ncbi:MAG: hypothetical protein F9K31_08635 [Dokdonella sp.]|nr:MAG: hypothetical protein F9K31_08635 [Dokdonella sp.]